MGRALPDVDISAKDSRWKCQRCAHRHRPNSICPPTRVWLVLGFCPDCRPNPTGPGRYCKRHMIKENPERAVVEVVRHGSAPPDRPGAPGLAD